VSWSAYHETEIHGQHGVAFADPQLNSKMVSIPQAARGLKREAGEILVMSEIEIFEQRGLALTTNKQKNEPERGAPVHDSL